MLDRLVTGVVRSALPWTAVVAPTLLMGRYRPVVAGVLLLLLCRFASLDCFATPLLRCFELVPATRAYETTLLVLLVALMWLPVALALSRNRGIHGRPPRFWGPRARVAWRLALLSAVVVWLRIEPRVAVLLEDPRVTASAQGAEARALAAAHALRSAAAQLRSAQQPSWRRRPRHKPPPHTYVGRFLERVEPPGDACLVERAEVASPQTPSGGAWTTAYLSTSTLMK